ncbi:hypothetical protein BCR34DRAFT_485682 [Clohesyomyces aquaticus]|uniref:Uncharacterized protein n=1 Tax=Clohesyomyces aquaticus TaxID=1231657 RepID=A0A1Y1ZJM9_9PLEO|nr:hypothetical protein BCR34DRAFT_485682 [Clohesyomyces aquaticus]
MDEQAQDDNTQGSIISRLTELDDDDTDEFGKLMMQNARDERRLENALRGNAQPFRKARTHPRVGLTLENLERNSNGPNGADARAGGVAKFESPPSVSSSGGSDPAIRVPSEWGRKGRVKRDWMRTIASDEERTPGPQEEETPRPKDPADRPLPSVEDSPFSHKSTPSSARRRTPADEEEQTWDFSLDLNEASIVASTPYFPRNTALDDIRQREIESLKEQAVTTNVLDRIRERSPSETRRPKPKPSLESLTNGVAAPEQARESGPSEIRLRKRAGSSKSTAKSLTFGGEAGEPAPKSPILMYKSVETVGVVDRGILANAQTSSKRPDHRREDSHELLRRLARVSSNTPSPGRSGIPRPRTAPARQPNENSPNVATEPSGSAENSVPAQQGTSSETTTNDTVATARENHTEPAQSVEQQQTSDPAPAPAPVAKPPDIDVTPMPVDRPALSAKTPVVTGAWIDTPAPRPALRPVDESRPRPQSPKKGGPSKKSSEKQKVPEPEEGPEESNDAPVERIRPALPRSALEAIVEEEKAHGRSQRPDDGYGDSTIDSLEDLMQPHIENSETAELDEDTLQGLGIPTGVPRNEAERQRQQELLHLHRMNDRLRAARTSIRDASRGMKRVENRVEHVEEGSDAVRVVYRDCPCAEEGHQCSPFSAAWKTLKSFFVDSRKSRLTWLSIALLTLFTWYILESLACDQYCHKFYASSMKGFGVDWDAPRFPFVIPTVTYRKILRPITQPVVWTWSSLFENEDARTAATRTARKVTTRIIQAHMQHTFDADPVMRMDDDEVM